MIIRFRSRMGMSRAEFQPTDTLQTLKDYVLFNVLKNQYTAENVSLCKDESDMGTPCSQVDEKTLQAAGLVHGNMVFLRLGSPRELPASTPVPPGKEGVAEVEVSKDNALSATNSSNVASAHVVQDNIDDAFELQDGLIPRSTSAFCRHGPKGMCDYCSPLEPYDENYQRENKIKHMSFHAYLRKVNSNVNKYASSQSFIPPLEEPYFKVKEKCPSGHPPWPLGICSKCQPSTIMMNLQPFRIVDHVEFASPSIVDSFLNAWRRTGFQRIGYTYGHYEPYTTVPLGTKAVIETIYEPPQISEADGVTLEEWPEEALVDRVAAACGLRRVGIIYTDLTDDGSATGKVLCKRHADSYFLSSLEVCNSAHFQSKFPNPSKWSQTGFFGSKFVTSVISGNFNGEIEVTSYQVSNVATSLFKADLIQPSIDPDRMLVKREDKSRYVPDVLYRYVDEYKKQVSKNAKPAFPVSFLLVTLTDGFPEEPTPMFAKHNTALPTVIETADETGRLRQLAKLFDHDAVKDGSLSNFPIILLLAQLSILKEDDMEAFAKYAMSPTEENEKNLNTRESYQTLLAVLYSSL
ncbi:Hrd1 ubiquitin ligase complex subunit Npl4 [Schizosaccharomyces osmophilus]|uniref:Nuclear protein localization protein 4 n=1 Tax=Schizosaccharomyces osmophilus TaxID=2545709 RepID=A0AAF0ATS3_9SCHI|nr:Hrd1 ubiquitin ligase complex subunit Npl4 [Schizosaccharomyces osmophilus]WBW70683.1 Hrd1 ubiquitin ligase complex subunit Npl4 [Schizosaccharomyces osmophilus]